MFFVFESGSPDEGACAGGLGDCIGKFSTLGDAIKSLPGLAKLTSCADIEILCGSTGLYYYASSGADDGDWVCGESRELVTRHDNP